MPRLTTDRLIGYAIASYTEQARVPSGENVTHDGGQPTIDYREIEFTILVLLDAQTGHRIEIPLDPDGKQNLIKHLTGGIVVVGGNLQPS